MRFDRSEATRFRRKIIRQEGICCEACGFTFAPVLQIHHATPLHQGAADQADNWIVLCPTCHSVVHKLIWANFWKISDSKRITTEKRKMYSAIEAWSKSVGGLIYWGNLMDIVQLLGHRGY